MAVVQSHAPIAASFRAGQSRTAGQSFYGRVARWFEEGRAIRQLESLSDRELEDMGVQRWQIRDAVRGTNLR